MSLDRVPQLIDFALLVNLKRLNSFIDFLKFLFGLLHLLSSLLMLLQNSQLKVDLFLLSQDLGLVFYSARLGEVLCQVPNSFLTQTVQALLLDRLVLLALFRQILVPHVRSGQP